jgi:hypothetical protein
MLHSAGGRSVENIRKRQNSPVPTAEANHVQDTSWQRASGQREYRIRILLYCKSFCSEFLSVVGLIKEGSCTVFL